MATQIEKGRAFRALHEREGAFIIPNPWDRGTARLLAHAGFAALATTSAGCAFSLGKADGQVGLLAAMEHVAAIAAATDLPVSGDLENGFGAAPETVAETIRLAASTGLVGGSIEDATGQQGNPIYEIEHAIERIQAAAEAARGLKFPFTLTARAENYLHGHADLKDTIRRLRSYQEAGADVLYAPGLTTRDDILAVVRSVDRPVNVLMGLEGAAFSLAELSEMGVKRVSVGSALSRAAMGTVMAAAKEMRERGTFNFARKAARFRDLNRLFAS
ncbi:MAG TPA: isocitrate lyase/phosphoenolpyruvate mutase family protein [Acidobacteriaceae bacterium]